MSDDEIIGLKSTAIKFKKDIKVFIFSSYLISVLLILILFKDFININFFSFLLFVFISSLFYQVIKFDENNKKSCIKLFKLNNFSGLLLFLSIMSINF